MVDFEALLRALTDAGVEFVIVGGVAATVYGKRALEARASARRGRSLPRLA